MDDKLYFDSGTLAFVNTELLFRMLAHHDLQLEMKFNPEKYTTKKDALDYLEDRRIRIVQDMFEQFGHTPKVDDIIK